MHCVAMVVAANLSVCAIAQGGNDQDISGEIVVKGKRLLGPDAVQDAVRGMSTERSFDRPLLRFHDPVCLAVTGLGLKASALIRERVLANAQEVGVEVGGKECRTNALILIVDDPSTLIRKMQSKKPVNEH